MVLHRKIFKKETNFWDQHKIKIASTLVAMLVWFLVVTGDEYEYRTTIPIQISPTNTDYILTSPMPERATIIVYGSGKLLFSFMLFREGRMRLNIDWEPGTQILLPSEQDIFLSGNAADLSLRRLISPDTIELVIEKKITRHVPVLNNIQLKPAPGYTIVGDVVIEPIAVDVRGPQSAVEAIDSVYTQSIVVEDLKFPFRKIFPLIKPANEQIELLTEEVTIAADIQKLMEKTIQDVPVTVRYLPQNFDAIVIPSQISVTVQGGAEIVPKIQKNDIDAYIEYYAELDSVGREFSVNIDPIEGIEFRNIEPDRIKVSLLTQDNY